MTGPNAAGGLSAQQTRTAAAAALDLAVARLLRVGILAAVAILVVGVVLLTIAGRSPLERPFPPFDLPQIAADVVAARPEGFLWLGLMAVIVTPISRVTASLVGYVRNGDRPMILISVGILAVIGTSIVLSVVLG
jgi:uncharacterized membrane protein